MNGRRVRHSHLCWRQKPENQKADAEVNAHSLSLPHLAKLARKPHSVKRKPYAGSPLPPPLSLETALWNIPTSKGLGLGDTVFYAHQPHTRREWVDWCLARNRIDDELKKYYRACTTGELPPQLLALSKKLDEELLKKQEHSLVA